MAWPWAHKYKWEDALNHIKIFGSMVKPIRYKSLFWIKV